jgi:glycolate oxidase
MHLQKVLKEILKVCVDCGGTLSGEHGIGVEKRALMSYQYDRQTLDLFARIKRAFDPNHLANPGKIIPVEYAKNAPCAELPEGDLYRFAQNPSQTALKKLNKIIEIDKTNYTATAQTGVTLTQLHQALKNEGVFCVLPARKITLGEAFSSGCYRGFYSEVLGIEALLHDGTPIHYGGKIMKNAAGYPLTHLFAGSQNRFGFVTQLTFKIYASKIPACTITEPQQLKPHFLLEMLEKEIPPKRELYD